LGFSVDHVIKTIQLNASNRNDENNIRKKI